ncbi:MAG TPA: hypothetical protein VEC18_07785, partial [Myxococcota bacterium]|nr:hypothetical protein [Myxococcota bacterium]
MPNTPRALLMLLLAALQLLACAASQPKPVRFSESAPPASAQDFANWPVEPLKAALLMEHAEYEVLSVVAAGAGTTRPAKEEVLFPETGDRFSVKGKLVPSTLDGFNNSPRKELAAWHIQTLFLDPVDFTVPATVLRCIPLERWEKRHEKRPPNIEGTRCMLGQFSIWMQDVTVPDELYEEERFLSDVRYAYHLANFNIFAYLINLRDSRKGNVLVSKDAANRRVFAVDNGVAFGTIWYNWFYPPTYAWRQIRVPALPRKSIDRLRKLERGDLDFLMVVAQLEADADGVLRSTPAGAPIDPDAGATRNGTTLQFGLTASEVDAIWERLESL